MRDSLDRNAAFLVANALLGAAAGFAFWLVAARGAPAAAVGEAAAVVSAFTLSALVGKLGFDGVLVRHAPRLDAASRRRLFERGLLATTAAAAAAAVAIASVAPAGAGRALLIASFAVATVAGWTIDAWFVADRNAAGAFVRNAAFHAVRLALVLFPAFLATAEGLAVAWGVAAAFSLGVAVALPRRVPGPASPPPLLAEGAANHAVGVAEFAPALVLPLVVAAALGPEANAGFHVAWTLAGVGLLASRAVAQAAFAERAAGRGPEALGRALVLQAAVLGPAVVAGILLGPAALAVLGPAYAAGSPLLVLLLLALLPATVNNLAVAELKAAGRRGALALYALLLFAGPVGGGALLLPRFGLVGPGLAWLLTSLVLLPASVSILPRAAARGWFRARVHGRRPHEG